MEHAILGQGTILELNTEEQSYLIQFDGMETTRQISFKVKLKKI